MFKLGSSVRDAITGYRGVITARTEWLNGCTRVQVQSVVLKDGKPLEPEWFDENQLEQIDDLLAAGREPPAETTGGPQKDPERLKGPSR